MVLQRAGIEEFRPEVPLPRQKTLHFSNIVELVEAVRAIQSPPQIRHFDLPYKEPAGLARQMGKTALSISEAFLDSSVRRRDYPLMVLTTASGMGKSRTGKEALKMIQEEIQERVRLELQPALHNAESISIEFNGGGERLDVSELDYSPSNTMGMRIAARALFNISYKKLRELLGDSLAKAMSIMTTDAVLRFIANERKADTGDDFTVTLLHVDEFQLAYDFSEKVKPGYSKQMISYVGDYMYNQGHRDKHLVFVLLTGTAPMGLSFKVSEQQSKLLKLEILSVDQANDVLLNTVPKSENLIKQPEFNLFLHDLGVVPGFLEILVRHLLTISSMFSTRKLARRNGLEIITKCLKKVDSKWNTDKIVLSSILKAVVCNYRFRVDSPLEESGSSTFMDPASAGLLYFRPSSKKDEFFLSWPHAAKNGGQPSPFLRAYLPALRMGGLLRAASREGMLSEDYADILESLFHIPGGSMAAEQGENAFDAILAFRMDLFEGQAVSLSHLFPGARMSNTLKKLKVITGSLSFLKAVKGSQRWINKKRNKDEIEIRKSMSPVMNQVRLCASGTYGVDFGLLVSAEKGSPLLLVVQTKFSAVDKSFCIKTALIALQEIKEVYPEYRIVMVLGVNGMVVAEEEKIESIDDSLVLYQSDGQHNISQFFPCIQHRMD